MAWTLRTAVVTFPTTQWRPRAAATRPLAGSQQPAGRVVYAALAGGCYPRMRSLAGWRRSGGSPRHVLCAPIAKEKKNALQTINFFFLSMHCWGWGIDRCEARVGAPCTRRLLPPQTSLCIDQHVTSVLISLQKAKVKCNRAAHRPRTWGGRCNERSVGPGAGCRQGSGGASASRRRCLPPTPLLPPHPRPPPPGGRRAPRPAPSSRALRGSGGGARLPGPAAAARRRRGAAGGRRPGGARGAPGGGAQGPDCRRRPRGWGESSPDIECSH